MTAAVICQWVVNELRVIRKHQPKLAAELDAVRRRAFLPKRIVDLWYSDYCYEEDDFLGQWADDGGPLYDLST